MACTIGRAAAACSSCTATSGACAARVCGANWPDRRAPLPKIPPHCACGGLARPGVVWFGEPLPDGMMKEAEHAAGAAEVFLVIGTSAAVYPAASLVPMRSRAEPRSIEINTDETPVHKPGGLLPARPGGRTAAAALGLKARFLVNHVEQRHPGSEPPDVFFDQVGTAAPPGCPSRPICEA